ncbi:secreted RxLR effector protein 161-like [Solenopsis invicta]|uniref:secreted RxLR effector protein 161-like n=1 Tax=Solenopsis invicta TaxID=13686 RepID=UPI00193E08BF|nr:secreted RxLR effector protein 161-like [Solenopsis invicta]
MSESKPVGTPVELGTQLRRNKKVSSEIKALPYRELVGALMYLSVCTRPDIAHVISYLSQFNCYSSIIGRRLNAKTSDPLIGFADADWANCVDDRKSYTGYAFVFGGCPISWESRKQKTTVLSSMEAEYMALSEATKEAVHLRSLLSELGFPYPKIKLWSDNCGAIKLAENPVFHNRSKHIDVRHHFVREMLEIGVIDIDHRPTEYMAADVLTKGLSGPKHRKC